MCLNKTPSPENQQKHRRTRIGVLLIGLFGEMFYQKDTYGIWFLIMLQRGIGFASRPVTALRTGRSGVAATRVRRRVALVVREATRLVLKYPGGRFECFLLVRGEQF